jgi:hypothetical protein
MNFNRLKHEKSVPKWLARKQIPMLNHDLYSSYLMCSKEPIFSQLKTSIRKWQLLKALSQNDFRRCFEAWKFSMGQCVASSGNYFEGDNMQIQ